MPDVISQETAAPQKTDTDKRMYQNRVIGLILAVAIIVVFTSLPPFEGLTDPAMASIGIFIAAIILFVMQVVPLAVTSLAIMVLLPYFGITTWDQIWKDFGGSSFFFVLFCFGVTGALSDTTIPLRISAFITKISKGNPKVIVYGFAFATCIISGFLSNFATLIMFYGIVLSFLKMSGRKPGESNLGKCLMIALPASSGIGGFISPAGSPGNLIAITLLQKEGVTVTFLEWFLMCAPFSLLMTFLLCFFLCLIFKPEPLPPEAAAVVLESRRALGNMSKKEKMAITIISTTVALWFASTWVTFLPIVVVAGCAFFLMFMPGIDLMDWKCFVREADWNLLFLIGSVTITMGSVNTTGAMGWIMNKLFSGLADLPTFLLFLIIGAIIAGLRVTIPTAPAVAAIFIPVLIGIYHLTGENLVALSFIPVFWSGATMLLVYTEPIFLYTYTAKYYSAIDLFKAGIFPTLIMIAIMAIVYPSWFAMFGY
jgi:sodium-dependent dicarboxylate transporter 2/3/5